MTWKSGLEYGPTHTRAIGTQSDHIRDRSILQTAVRPIALGTRTRAIGTQTFLQGQISREPAPTVAWIQARLDRQEL